LKPDAGAVVSGYWSRRMLEKGTVAKSK